MVSIIVPVYNSSKNLETCLLSLVKQTLKDIEIIIIDDASSDNSREIIKDFVTKYPSVKAYYNKKNIGAGATRNRGITLAKGEYIGFVDSDDYVNTTMYEYMYEEAQKNNFPDMIMTRLIFVKDNDYALKNLSFASINQSSFITNKKETMLGLSPSVCNKLFKKELIGNYKFLEDCKWEDIAFTFSMYMKSDKVITLNNPDYFYRRNIDSGISAINYQKNDKILEIFKVTDEIINFAKNIGKFDEYKSEIYFIYFTSVFTRISEIEYWECNLQEKQAIKNSIYKILYIKYGQINFDDALLSSRNSMEIIEEYRNFCNEMKNVRTNKK